MESFSVKFSRDEIVPQSDLQVGTALRKHLSNSNHTKVLIWNTKNYTVQAIRAKFNIGKSLIMRQRGKYNERLYSFYKVCSNANPLHYYVLWILHKADRWH